jgi:predicted GIY-YIG superfamily endonuclease
MKKSRTSWFQSNKSRDPLVDLAGRLFTSIVRMPGHKRFVYVLKSADLTAEFYVGVTADVSARLQAHNRGECTHTASRGPWERHVVIEFRDEGTAVRFERHLKSGSGRAFAKRHFA